MIFRQINFYGFISTALDWCLFLYRSTSDRSQPPCPLGKKTGNRATSAIRRDSTLSKIPYRRPSFRVQMTHRTMPQAGSRQLLQLAGS